MDPAELFEPRKNFWRRLILIGVVIGVFGLLSYKAIRFGIAETYLYLAMREAARPIGKDAFSFDQKWTQVKHYLSEGLRYDPGNPRAVHESGRHDMALGKQLPAVKPVAMRTAAEYFRQAVAARPTWSNAWTNLAIAKYELGILDRKMNDAEMHDALRHADELAPWDYDVQYFVLFMNLNLWPSLDAARRAATIKAVERSVQRDPARVAPLLQRFGRLDLMCDSGNGNAKVRELCSQLRKAAAAGKPRGR